jgi:hypothetical protein
MKLWEFLAKAEQRDYNAGENQRGPLKPLLPGAKKRRREVTPPEELNSEDERHYVQDEDSSYKLSSSSIMGHGQLCSKQLEISGCGRRF